MAVTIDDTGKKVKMIVAPPELLQATFIFNGLDPNGHALIECVESINKLFPVGSNYRTRKSNLKLV
jgi:hypothetical protein